MLEEMGEFFDTRVDSYDEHQLTCIDSAKDFYPYTASLLPKTPNSAILDLGCGTGLEFIHYFRDVPTAKITGIDLAPGMLRALRNRFPDKNVHLICASYFDVSFGENRFDAAVSVESLHHFTKDKKIALYAKLLKALKIGGYFILTDYFAASGEEEQRFRQELARLMKEQGAQEGAFYHYDTPLTVEHEKEALLEAGFATAEALRSFGATHVIKATR